MWHLEHRNDRSFKEVLFGSIDQEAVECESGGTLLFGFFVTILLNAALKTKNKKKKKHFEVLI
jgi:hypothetical protein